MDRDQFYLDTEKRERLRREINCFSNTTVGVYVGKFGDIYYKEEVIPVFEEAFRVFDDFRLLILTPQNDAFTERLKSLFGDKIFLLKVQHNEVKDYLSASDFAFATIREDAVRTYCSPIKIGEYWACGLPIFISEGIGDDSQIIEETGLGAVFTNVKPQTIKNGLEHIKTLINKDGVKEEIQGLAKKHRSINRTKEAYEKLVFN